MIRRRWAAFRNDRRAVAIVEFALTVPILALSLGVATDYGLREWDRSCLVNAVAEGAYYAFRTGTSVSTTTVQAVVQNASSLSYLTGVSFKRAIAAVASFCPSGSPAILNAAVTAGSACSDGSTAGKYIVITASYSLTSLISYSGIAGQSISESVTVRLQ